VTYRLQADFLAGTIPDVTFIDALPDGLQLLPDTVRLGRVFDTGLEASLNPGGVNSAPDGAFVTLTEGVDFSVSGQVLEVPLGDVSNFDGDFDTESFIVELEALVLNSTDNAAGTVLVNEASLAYSNASGPQALNAQPIAVTIIEAALQIVKTASPTVIDGDNGGFVHFVVRLTNSSGAFVAPAFDAEIFDQMPTAYSMVANMTVTTSEGVTGVFNRSNIYKVDVNATFIPPGGWVVLEFDTVAPGPIAEKIVNAVRGTWTSVPGRSGTGGAVPGSPGSIQGERNASNGYKVNDKATVFATHAPPTPTSTPEPTAGGVATVVPLATTTPTPPAGATPTAAAAATPNGPIGEARLGDMGVRLVTIGRAHVGTDLHYTAALVVYSRDIAPDVTAELTLAPELEFMWANPAPLSTPEGDSGGVVRWELGDLQGPANRPLEVNARVREEAIFNQLFTSYLRVENGFGETLNLSRTSWAGKNRREKLAKARTDSLTANVRAPRMSRPGSRVRYTITAASRNRGGFGDMLVTSVVPVGVEVNSVSPSPISVDTGADGGSIIQWRFPAGTRRARMKIDGLAAGNLQPGNVLENSVVFDDGVGTPVVTVGSTRIR
jgi:hypothetical protein